MPFTAGELQAAGLASLNFHMRNNPIDQIGVERPFLRALMKGKKSFPGGKEHIVEQLRTSYGSNFQWYYGSQTVTYNTRSTLAQSFFPWRSAHDGYTMNEDEFFQNGITIADGKPGNNSAFERDRLTNLFEENNEALRLGFDESFDMELCRDGTQHAEALAGLDHIVSLTPAVGTMGGIDRSTETYWRNHVATALTSSTVVGAMETGWRACSRNGGRVNFIMAGSDFVDAFRTGAKTEIDRYKVVNGPTELDPAIKQAGIHTGLHFNGTPILWNPVFADLDAADSPLTPWEKRCYFLNLKHFRLRPAEGHDMVTRNPPRVYDKYAYYWGLTWKGSLTTNRANAHAVFAIS